MSGVFGVVSEGNCARTLFYGTDYHSHLGTEYGGLAVLGKDFTRRIHNLSQSQFKSKFHDDYELIEGNKGIGVISDYDEQPIYLNSRFGPFCIVTSGFVENAEELTGQLLNKGVSFCEVSKRAVNTPELIAKLINQGDSLVDGIEKVFDAIKGSCSLLVLHRDGVYVARDRLGYTPLVVGRRSDAWAVTSETSAFPNNGFEAVKNVEPGEILLINDRGLMQRRPGWGGGNQICAFLWIYTGFPASTYEGVNVEIVRERCGRYLARGDRDIDIDLVSGVPDSGFAHGLGYAMESGKPFRRPLVKYTPGYGRSYTPPSQQRRDLIAKMKLIPIKEVIEGNSIVICEDSIVRGTQLKNFTIKKLWDCGARQVHVRPACPPLMFPCRFNLSTRSTSELAARRAIRSLEGRDIEDVSEYIDHTCEKYRKMVEWIARDLRVTTLRYQRLDDMVEAIGLPAEQLCLYCWNGRCPESTRSRPPVEIAEVRARGWTSGGGPTGVKKAPAPAARISIYIPFQLWSEILAFPVAGAARQFSPAGLCCSALLPTRILEHRLRMYHRPARRLCFSGPDAVSIRGACAEKKRCGLIRQPHPLAGAASLGGRDHPTEIFLSKPVTGIADCKARTGPSMKRRLHISIKTADSLVQERNAIPIKSLISVLIRGSRCVVAVKVFVGGANSRLATGMVCDWAFCCAGQNGEETDCVRVLSLGGPRGFLSGPVSLSMHRPVSLWNPAAHTSRARFTSPRCYKNYRRRG